MRYGYGIPIPSAQGGGSGSNAYALRLRPVVATSSNIGWRNATGQIAKYLESVAIADNAGSHANNITQGTESSRPMCLRHDGKNFLHLSNVAGNNASVPDSADLDLTDNFTLEYTGTVQGSGGAENLISKGGSYILYIEINGELRFFYTISSIGGQVGAGASPSALADAVRVTRAGTAVTFYQRISGVWSVLGSPSVIPSGAVDANTDSLLIGGMHKGKCSQIQVWPTTTPDSSSPVLDVDFSTFSHGATSGNAETGQTVTINQSGTNPAFIVGRSMVYYDGVDDWMTLGAPLWTGNQARTLVVVYQQTTLSPFINIVGQGDGTGPESTFFKLIAANDAVKGDPYLHGWGAGYDLTDGATPTLTRKVAVVAHDGLTTRLYRNGAEIASALRTFATASANFDVGKASPSFDPFGGYLEDIYAFDYALTPAQVATLTSTLQ